MRGNAELLYASDVADWASKPHSQERRLESPPATVCVRPRVDGHQRGSASEPSRTAKALDGPPVGTPAYSEMPTRDGLPVRLRLKPGHRVDVDRLGDGHRPAMARQPP